MLKQSSNQGRGELVVSLVFGTLAVVAGIVVAVWLVRSQPSVTDRSCPRPSDGRAPVCGPSSEVAEKPAGAPDIAQVRKSIDDFLSQYSAADIPEQDRVPQGTRLLDAHMDGTRITMDFSRELLGKSKDLGFFEVWQRALIGAVEKTAPELRDFTVRVREEDGAMRLLDDYLRIPPDKRPVPDSTPPPPEGE